jgi:hypothetical protein
VRSKVEIRGADAQAKGDQGVRTPHNQHHHRQKAHFREKQTRPGSRFGGKRTHPLRPHVYPRPPTPNPTPNPTPTQQHEP